MFLWMRTPTCLHQDHIHRQAYQAWPNKLTWNQWDILKRDDINFPTRCSLACCNSYAISSGKLWHAGKTRLVAPTFVIHLLAHLWTHELFNGICSSHGRQTARPDSHRQVHVGKPTTCAGFDCRSTPWENWWCVVVAPTNHAPTWHHDCACRGRSLFVACPRVMVLRMSIVRAHQVAGYIRSFQLESFAFEHTFKQMWINDWSIKKCTQFLVFPMHDMSNLYMIFQKNIVWDKVSGITIIRKMHHNTHSVYHERFLRRKISDVLVVP